MPRPSGDLADPSFWSAWIQTSHLLYQRGGALNFLIRRVETDSAIIGQIDYSLIMRGPLNSTMVGFQIGQAYEGQGLMREGMELSLGHVFRVAGLRRVVAAFVPENVRSERLIMSLGFTKEGISREFLEIDGRPRDHVITARLASD